MDEHAERRRLISRRRIASGVTEHFNITVAPRIAGWPRRETGLLHESRHGDTGYGGAGKRLEKVERRIAALFRGLLARRVVPVRQNGGRDRWRRPAGHRDSMWAARWT